MLNNDMLLGGTNAPGWRKIIVTPGSYGHKYSYGYSSGKVGAFGYYWNFPGSSLSDKEIDGYLITGIFCGEYEQDRYTGESYDTDYIGVSVITFSSLFPRNSPLYIKVSKTGKVFTLTQGYQTPNYNYIEHYRAEYSTSSAHSDFIFKQENINKELDIYIGLTPPPIRNKRKLTKRKHRKAYSLA